ncbi:hypothetical protein C7W93_10355 [Glaciimonas sp. PCH181]|nr:hypothetical protein C7W93_10355 [Glaciimonas sp. PCH181]
MTERPVSALQPLPTALRAMDNVSQPVKKIDDAVKLSPKKSIGPQKITPDSQGKNALSRQPQSMGRKSAQRHTTSYYLDHYVHHDVGHSEYDSDDSFDADARGFSSHISAKKNAVSNKGIPATQVPDSLRGRRNIASGFDSKHGLSRTENQRDEHPLQVRIPGMRIQEEPYEVLLGNEIPNTAMPVTMYPIPILPELTSTVFAAPVLAPFIIRPLTKMRVYEAVLVLMLEGVHDCSRETAQRAVADLNTNLYDVWRNVTSAEEINRIWGDNFVFDRDMAMALHDIMAWLGDDAWRLYIDGEHDGAINLGIGKYHHREFIDYVGRGEPIYCEMLTRLNVETIDMQQLSREGFASLNLLKVVCTQHKQPLPLAVVLTREPGQTYNILIDQAALLAQAVQKNNLNAEPLSEVPPSMPDIQAMFLLDLLDDLEDRQIAQLRLPSTQIPLAYGKFWYSGSAINGAIGLNADGLAKVLFNSPYLPDSTVVMQIIPQTPGVLPAISAEALETLRNQSSAVLSLPEYARRRYPQRSEAVACGELWLTLADYKTIVSKMMSDWMLDRVWPIGSPHHSIATIIQREGPAYGLPLRANANLELLIEDLLGLNAAWSNESKNAISPVVLAALHRATALRMPMLDLDAGDTRARQTARLVEHRYAPLLVGEAVRDWLHLFLPRLEQSMLPLQIPGPDSILPLLGSIIKYYGDCMKAPEVLRYTGPDDFIVRLQAWFYDGLRAYQKPPKYSQNAEIRRLMQRNGLTNVEIDTRKLVTIPPSEQFDYRQRHFYLSPFEEFKLKDQLNLRDMILKGRIIDVQKEVKEIATGFKTYLLDHPVVRSRVRESLRMSGIIYNDADFDSLLKFQVLQMVGVAPESLTEVLYNTLSKHVIGSSIGHFILAGILSGDLRGIEELVPFLEGTIDIVHGLVKGNGTEAIEGALDISEDALGILMFGLAEGIVRRGMLKIAGSASWNAIRQAAETALLTVESKLFESAQRMSSREAANIALLKEASIPLPGLAQDIVSNARKVMLNQDPHNVAFSPFISTNSFAALAPRVLKGEQLNFMTPTKDVLRMVDLGGGRVGVVHPAIFCVVQCNLAGEKILDARPIFVTNTASNRMEVSAGLPGGSAGVSRAELAQRLSVKPVVDYLEKIKGTPGLNDWNPDFLDLFLSLFRFENPGHPEAREFEKYMATLYERSPLMRVIANYAEQTNKGKFFKIVFDAESARADGRTLTFINAEKLKKVHFMSETGPAPITREDMWLHEGLHALTDLEDVPARLGRSNRGPTVVLADWIQREAALGPELINQRIWYEKAFLDGPPGKLVSMAPEQTNAIGVGVDNMDAEDNYLGEMIRKITFPAGHPDVGLSIAEPRITILEMQKLDVLLALNPGRSRWPVESILRTRLDNMAALADTEGLRTIINNISETLIEDKRFNALYSPWIENNHVTPVKIKFSALKQGSGPLAAYQIDRGGELTTLILNAKPVYYFDAHGAKLMSDRRKLIGALVDLISPEELDAIEAGHVIDPYRDRGQKVLLENALMQTMNKKPLPQRICKALTSRSDGWLARKSGVAQSAQDEDHVLAALALNR